MKRITVRTSEIEESQNNPRIIRNSKYEKLVKSVSDLQVMLEARPIVVSEGKAIGGNMRLQAAKELGIEELTVIDVSDWSKEKKDEFIIKDNLNYGEWDYDKLANEWDGMKLDDWGIDLWQPEEEIDDSLLDELEGDNEKVGEMENEVVHALQVKFHAEDYEEAQSLIKLKREREQYVGGYLLRALESAKEVLT